MKNANLLLYLNLAGEVFYIIVHRMKSQKVKEEHQERVRNDIAVAICHTTVIQNLLKGSLQILNLKLSDVRILMDRIVHSSIMTVNSFSMEKLFELTLIATKYQYTTCQYPSDILLIVLNHLDTMRKTTTDATAKTLAENLHNLMVDRFKDVDIRTMQTYRYLILSYLADVKLKMTNLIRLGLQKTTGDFVKQFPDKVKRAELHQPGLIEVYKLPEQDEVGQVTCTSDCGSSCECDGFDQEEALTAVAATPENRPIQVRESACKGSEILTTKFKMVADQSSPAFTSLRTSLALNGDRGVVLGLSIYDIPGNCDDATTQNVDPEDSIERKSKPEVEADKPDSDLPIRDSSDVDRHYYLESSDFYATKGLDLCSVLLGCGDPTETTASISKLSDPLEASTSSTTHNSQLVSASALGLESVLEYFPAMSFNKPNTGRESDYSAPETVIDEQLNMNPNSINVIKFDARSGTTGSKAALVAIAQDFFELEAEEKADSQGSKCKSMMDDLLNGLDFPDD